MQEDQPGPPVPTVEFCYRHPGEETRVHCTRCERPICPACMIPAPVGHQCPECVAQARREFRQGPTRRMRTLGGVSATKALLVAILAMYIVEVLAGGPGALVRGPSESTLLDLGALFSPAIALGGQYWRLFTAMFLHAGLIHIAFNAYALWLFGTLIEGTFGRARFLLIYFVSGFLASVASYAFGPMAVGVGASGAIFGVFGAFVAYNYRRRYLAAAAANLRWAFTLILLNAFLAFSYRAIDWRAHLGGLVAGCAAGLLAEGVGPPGARTATRVAGFAGLVLLGVALVVWRTNELRAALPFA